jgi:hypothetical protein
VYLVFAKSVSMKSLVPRPRERGKGASSRTSTVEQCRSEMLTTRPFMDALNLMLFYPCCNCCRCPRCLVGALNSRLFSIARPVVFN